MERAGDPQSPLDWLLFGLGNPGTRYLATRHNLGWRWIDRLAERWGVRLSAGRADYFHARATSAAGRVHLIKPTTWMNLSGRAVRQYLAIERPAAPRVVVGIDDAAILLGRLRVRPRGSAGGHNGLASVIEHLGSEDFPRVRMGVGPVPPGADLADFVLEEFAREEREAVEALLDRACDATVCLLEEGPEAAMARFNG